MENLTLSTIVQTRKGLPNCHIHKTEQLSWFCLEQSCQKRLFCSFCIIQDHSRIHKNFVDIYTFLKDPVIALNKLDAVEPGRPESDISLKVRFKVEETVEREERILGNVFEKMKLELKDKLASLQSNFKNDLRSFLSMNEESFIVLEKMKESYSEQSREIFQNIDLNEASCLQQGINELFNRYHQDEAIYKQINETIAKIPQIKTEEEAGTKVSGVLVKELVWPIFFTKNKISKFNYSWTFDLEKNCGDMEFSNSGLTVKKNGANHPSTLLGSNILDTLGEVSWSIRIDEHVGAYICLGIISTAINPNLRDNNYGNAHCVCSDNTTYNITHVSGDLRMMAGDEISFKYNAPQNEFFAVGPQNRFVFRSQLLAGNTYKPFFGFAASARIKLTILFPL